LAISAILQPCYDIGGDGFDYSIDASTAHFLLLDSMGRGLTAGLAFSMALASLRAARRAGGGLDAQARAADADLAGQFAETRFVAGLLAELDLETGRLRYVNAGMPPPLLLRKGRLVRRLTEGGRMPLGVADSSIEPAEAALEPDDRLLLYSDGVADARRPGGDRFGEHRLADLAEQHHAAGLPAPETLRRLAQAVLRHQGGPPTDDATLLLAAWSPGEVQRTIPGPPWPTAEGE
jgi:serine phosphatase RsbU (regulator of sigma subunit)